MKLIIEISDKMYKTVQDGTYCGSLYEELKNGIPVEPCGDCISRQAAIGAIDALYLDGDSCVSFRANAEGDTLIGKYQAITALDDLPSVTPQPKMVERWIPVSERLPNFAGVYLVTRYFPNNVMNPTYLVDACFFDGTDTWHNDNRINHDRKYLTNVVAWLEEPEPYNASPTWAEGSEE